MRSWASSKQPTLMLPDARCLETAKKSFYQPILLRTVRGNNSCSRPSPDKRVESGDPERLTRSHFEEPGVEPTGRRVPKRMRQATSIARSPSSAHPRTTNASPISSLIMPIHHGDQMPPPILPTGHMRYIQGPAPLTRCRSTPTALPSRP